MTLNALTVDLEEYFQVSNFDAVIDRGRWDALPSRVGEATARLLDRFERAGSSATFFVLGWVAERQPALVREIAKRGHEIACHGHGHELVYALGAERFRPRQRQGKKHRVARRNVSCRDRGRSWRDVGRGFSPGDVGRT